MLGCSSRFYGSGVFCLRCSCTYCTVPDLDLRKLYEFCGRTWQRYLSNFVNPRDARENGTHNARRACGVSISEFSHGFLAYVIVMRVNLYEDTRNRDDRRTLFPAPFTLTNVS
jgi:hypothetical protein